MIGAGPGTTPAVPAGSGVRVDLDHLIELRLRAQSLRIRRTRRARRPLAGGHESRLRGRGMEFAESRAYMPGDDIRAMDWRVTARTGRAHTKVFQEERERPVVIILDLGPSMYFGSQRVFKSVAGAELAALVAWLSAARNDRVGGLVFAGSAHRELRPAGGRRGVLKYLRAVAEMDGLADPARDTPGAEDAAQRDASLGGVLLRARRIARPGSLCVVLSDFYAIDPDVERHLKRLREHGDVRVAWLQDPLEMRPPPPGRYSVSDGARFASLDLGAGGMRTLYREFFETRRVELEEICARSNVPLTLASSARDPVDVVRELLADR